VSGKVGLAIDDSKDLELGELAAATLGNVGEIGHRDGEQRRDGPVASGIDPVARRAGHLELAFTAGDCVIVVRWGPGVARRARCQDHRDQRNGDTSDR
jgi:hypothetical protein